MITGSTRKAKGGVYMFDHTQKFVLKEEKDQEMK